MTPPSKNCLVVLGPTASGKTSLAVYLAHAFGGEIISADSRQVYRGLDIGAGKDLDEYEIDGNRIDYHLIDVAGLDEEFNVFRYQQQCYETLEKLHARNVLPVIAGGTGLYLDAVLKGYRMTDVPENAKLRQELSQLPDSDLSARLRAIRPEPHNTTDLEERERTVRAIEIAEHTKQYPSPPAPEIDALVLGIRWERPELHRRIEMRLRERLEGGMIEEVSSLLSKDIDPERLRALGLEYRFVTDFLSGTIKNRNDLFQKLSVAIKNFAKRQDTWFRKMERNGLKILWLDGADKETAHRAAVEAFPGRGSPLD